MKKVLSYLIVFMMILLPLSAKAIRINKGANCDQGDDNNNHTCTVVYEGASANENNLVITLTPKGGATLTDAYTLSGSDWTVTNVDKTGTEWKVTVSSPGITGEGDLFQFTYVASGSDDCGVDMSVNGQTVTTTPSTPDKPADNKDTGSALPYVALGTIALVAVGAYLATRNKAKMYKI